jgi:hypothetical protein
MFRDWLHNCMTLMGVGGCLLRQLESQLLCSSCGGDSWQALGGKAVADIAVGQELQLLSWEVLEQAETVLVAAAAAASAASQGLSVNSQ